MEYAIYIYIHGLYTILVIESDRILFFLCLWETWFGGEKKSFKPGLVLDLFIMGFIGIPFWWY
jgi:hypothetical protein